jgi:serine/threonine-protein kinase
VEPGQRQVAGRYELRALLATGGMGQVWRAYDALLGRPVAVKVLRSEYTGDPTFLARFRAEAQHAALLAHRNIATVHDYGEVSAEDGGEHLAYLVMELVEGEPLSTVLARERRLDVPATLDLLHQTASALAAAHAAGVVHRDVKPGNVLMGDDGIVKITDFGIAWSASDVPLTQTGQVVGTAHYLSPEQAEGGKASPASDVYALGMIAYECLAGRRAFEGDNAIQIALRQISDIPDPLPTDIPAAVRSLVGRALLKDPSQRFADGAAFRDAVAEVLAGREVPAPPPPVLPIEPSTTPLAPSGHPAVAAPSPERRRSRRWRRALVPAATLVAGAVIGVGTLEFIGGSEDPTPVASGLSVGDGAVAQGTASIRLVAADYVGRPFRDVEADLVGLGLQVVLTTTQISGTQPGLVAAVDPVGTLHPGDSVTVTYAVAPAAAPTTAEPPDEVAMVPAGAVSGPGPSTSPAAQPTARASAAGTPRGSGDGPGGPGDGAGDEPHHGHGHGHGHHEDD